MPLLFLVACHDDPGFEIVRVPQSAYAAHDASVKSDAAPVAAEDAGPDLLVLCIKKESKDDDDDSKPASDSDENDTDCAKEYQGRNYDARSTSRHRTKDGDSTICCYRKGRVPRSETTDGP